ncbi:MAG: alpha/beta hydrolase [Alphaproteobacteria bacterium]|nr:alpha/beta hydrolase [Alphaproteobacteria bacterium]MBV9694164.1 alpha/beta hydrolase [Alphaproteobacteria bacterium]
MRGWILAATLLAASGAHAQQWMSLPPTPTLPKADKSGYAPVNGIRIWYAQFGRGEPLLFLHGGLGNSNYWGNQVRVFSSSYRVIVMDSRGHGRSTRDGRPYGYDLMASDVVALLDYLKIDRVALVGWSDGAIIGLDIAMHHPERLSKVFAFAANIDPSGVSDASHSPVANAFIARAGKEYAALSPTPKRYQSFLAEIEKMWSTQPHWTRADFARITVPIWIADGDHDEMVNHDQPRTLADWTPRAGLLIEPDVSHFAILQDPEQFNHDLAHFLKSR